MKHFTRIVERPLVAVLAAGRATRFGGGKLEAPCAGKPLGRWAIEAVEAAGLGQGVIVTGPEGVSFAEGWTTLVNTRPEEGQATSLAIAARYALEREALSLLVLLADMPLVTPEYVRELATQVPPATTRYADGEPGVPVLLDRLPIELASSMRGDRGPRFLLGKGIRLEPPPGMLLDVDTPDDLLEVERHLLRG